MIGIYTQFGLSSNYSYNKNCTIPYFINLITDRANFSISGPTSFLELDSDIEWISFPIFKQYTKKNKHTCAMI